MRKFVLLIVFQILFLQTANCAQINLNFFNKFNDRYFEEYIKEAIENNHDLKQACHRLEQYRYEIRKQFGYELPHLSSGANYLGNHFPKGDPNFLIKENSFIMPSILMFEPDLLLKNWDKVRSKKKLYEAQNAKRQGIYLSLLTDVANAYINILLYDYLIDRQIEILKDKAQNLDFNRDKYNLGVISFIDLNNIFAELNSQKILYNNLVKQQKSTLYNFATLLGRSAYNIEEIKRGKLEDFEYQETIPDIINSDLIYSRPDIEEIENELKSAKIDIQVAKKDFFPSFNINGLLAFDSANGGEFFSWNSAFAALIAGVSQDVFKGGIKFANLKLKKERYLELVEKYRQKDLDAIKEINNALNSIKEDKEAENSALEQLRYEEKNYIASRAKLKEGVISILDHLQNKNSLRQRQQLSATIRANRLMDYFTLYKSTGGQL